MTVPRLDDVIDTADLLFDRDALEDAIESMAEEIADEYGDDDVPPVYITIMHGGMPFATQLAFAIGENEVDLEFDYLHATRYRGNTTGSGLAWLHRPATPLQGRRVLLVDDILDEGHTLKAVRQWVEDQGAIDVRVAVLADKVHDRRVDDIEADYVGVEVPDRYVFGYGMDFHEQGRNLPGIYALAE